MPERDHHAAMQFCLTEVEVRPSDITSVKERIGSVDPRDLVDHMLIEQGCWDPGIACVGGAARAMLSARIAALIELMAAIPSEPAAFASRIIIPCQQFWRIDDRGAFRRSVGAALVDLDHLAQAEAVVARAEEQPISLAAWQRYCCSSLAGSLFDELLMCDAVFESAALADAPWPDVLGCRIWIPSELTRTEVAMMLADVLWSMTSRGFGFDPASVAAAPPVSSSEEVPVRDPAYQEKLSAFCEALNFNGWAAAIKAASQAARSRTLSSGRPLHG